MHILSYPEIAQKYHIMDKRKHRIRMQQEKYLGVAECIARLGMTEI